MWHTDEIFKKLSSNRSKDNPGVEQVGRLLNHYDKFVEESIGKDHRNGEDLGILGVR